MNQLKKSLVFLITVALCGLISEAGAGSAEAQTKLIALIAGGPQQGTFQSQYLTINYQYTLIQNQLAISGNLTFDDSLTMNYPGLRHFYMELVFADSQGNVVQRSSVTLKSGFTWGDDDAVAASSFSAQLSVPSGTASMSYYYNGATQGGMGGGIGTSFWFDPASKGN